MRERTTQEEEIKNQVVSLHACFVLLVQLSHTPRLLNVTVLTLTPIKVDSERKGGKGDIFLPMFSKVSQGTEPEKYSTQHEETLTRYRCVREKASRAAVALKHQPTLAVLVSTKYPLEYTYVYGLFLCVYPQIQI